MDPNNSVIKRLWCIVQGNYACLYQSRACAFHVCPKAGVLCELSNHGQKRKKKLIAFRAEFIKITNEKKKISCCSNSYTISVEETDNALYNSTLGKIISRLRFEIFSPGNRI